MSWTVEAPLYEVLRYRIRRESVDTRYQWLSEEVVWDPTVPVLLSLRAPRRRRRTASEATMPAPADPPESACAGGGSGSICAPDAMTPTAIASFLELRLTSVECPRHRRVGPSERGPRRVANSAATCASTEPPCGVGPIAASGSTQTGGSGPQ